MKYILLLLIVTLVAGCSPQVRVYSDHDPDYQVSNFSTFDWGQVDNIEAGKNPIHYNELNDKRIKAAVLAELLSHGYRRTQENPELIIHYHIVVDDQSIVTTDPYGYTYGPYWIRTRTNVYAYREGTLIIDLMDPNKGNLVWRGWATADMNSLSPNHAEKIINRAVEKIFKKFPDSEKAISEPMVLH